MIQETEWYKCKNCGEIMRGEDIQEIKESLGMNRYGEHGEESYCICPKCGIDQFDELGLCVICGNHTDGEYDGMCEQCISQYENDIKKCFEVGKNSTETFELNCFLASMFSVNEIEAILFDALNRERMTCRRFIEEDPSWFGKCVIEMNKECENVNK